MNPDKTCEFCGDVDVPEYPLRLELSGPNFQRIVRPARICSGCIGQMFFGEPGRHVGTFLSLRGA